MAATVTTEQLHAAVTVPTEQLHVAVSVTVPTEQLHHCMWLCGLCLYRHAASSGFLASPNPIAVIPFARASGKGLL